MKRAEYIKKGFVNDLEPQSHADRSGEPGNVKIGGKAVQVGRTNHRKGQNLGDDVGKEKLKSAVLAATEHSDGNHRLHDGLSDPQGVKKNPDFFAHGGGFNFLSTAVPEPASQHCIRTGRL